MMVESRRIGWLCVNIVIWDAFQIRGTRNGLGGREEGREEGGRRREGGGR